MTKYIVISIVILLMLNISCRKKEIKENSIYFYNNTTDTLLMKQYNGSSGTSQNSKINPFDNSMLWEGDDYNKTPTMIFRNDDSVFISKNSDTSIWIKFFSNKQPFNYSINPATNDSAWIFKGTTKGGHKTNFTTIHILYYNYWFEIK